MSTAARVSGTRSALAGHRLSRTLLFHGGVLIVSVVMIYPLLWLLSSSLKPTDQIWTHVTSLIPRHPTIQNYLQGWLGFGGPTFLIFYKNSIIYSGLATIGSVFASAFIAFGFARVRFRGRRVLFGMMLATLMLPVEVQIIPQYILFSYLHWINTFLPLVVPQFLGQGGQPFFIFMTVQFIRGIPKELDEAAQIDGAGKMLIFFRVILPLLKPVLTTTAIFAFYWTWGDFLGPLIYLNRPELYTVSVALRAFADPSGLTNWGQIFAMSTLSLIPVIVIFLAFQKNIVEGISTTGLKG